jgi:osmotically-inducible protein OsmY
MAEYRGYRGEREDFESDDMRYRRGEHRRGQQHAEGGSRDWYGGGDFGRYGNEGGWSGGQQQAGYGSQQGGDRGRYGSQQSGFDQGGTGQYGYDQGRRSQSGYGMGDYDEWSGSSGPRGFADREGYRSRDYGGGAGSQRDYARTAYDRSSFDRGYGRGGSRWSGSRPYGGSERGYTEGGRDFWDRASDEVSSWFGDEDAERRRRFDQFRGRGPKNYTRSAERIKEDVNDRLSDDGSLDASDIDVEVSGSDVTLSGQVSSRWDKRRAEDIAEAVSGVRHVQNNLRVRQQDDASTSSRPITGGLSSTTGIGEGTPSTRRSST